MRLNIFIVITFLFTSFGLAPTGQAQIGVSGNNAVLMEQSSGRVLFEKDAHQKQTIASITKVMTAIIAIESGKMDDVTKASRRSIYAEGSSIYLEQGEKMSIKDLIYGLMLRSGNDAAVSIAEHIGGSVEGFVYLMNEKAEWLGMTNTHFDNPHGLDSEDHYSTAYDMALLMSYAMNNEDFQQIAKTDLHHPESRSYGWKNKNKLLSLYEYCTGGKTGFTKKAGRTLITTANKKNMSLVAVTLNAPDDWNDHIQMYEWGFKNYEMQAIVNKGEHHYRLEGAENSTKGYLHHDIQYPLTKEEQSIINRKSFLLPSIKKDKSKIGKTVIYLDSTPIIDVPIFATKNTGQENMTTNIITMLKQIVGFDQDG